MVHALLFGIINFDVFMLLLFSVLLNSFCLTARARKDTQKIDHSVKERAARLNHFARVCI